MTRAVLIMFAAALALCVVVVNNAPAGAQGTAREQSACRGDAKRFCRHALSGGPFAVGACLAFNKSRLSQQCRAVLANRGM